jgi:hypothetical protein
VSPRWYGPQEASIPPNPGHSNPSWNRHGAANRLEMGKNRARTCSDGEAHWLSNKVKQQG